MKNLKRPEKRLISNVIIALLTLCLVAGVYLHYTRLELITGVSEKYQAKIDSLQSVVNKSYYELDNLQLKVDSLEQRKTIIINNYHEKVNVIRDASAAEHARWFESVIRELKDYREP